MTTSCIGADPASRPATAWVAQLAGCKSRGIPDGDPRIVECRQALAFWRCWKAIDAEVGQLSQPGIDALVDQLRAAAVPR